MLLVDASPWNHKGRERATCAAKPSGAATVKHTAPQSISFASSSSVGISRESWSIRASDDCLLLRSVTLYRGNSLEKSPIPNLNSVRVGYARRRISFLRDFSLCWWTLVSVIMLRYWGIISSVSITRITFDSLKHFTKIRRARNEIKRNRIVKLCNFSRTYLSFFLRVFKIFLRE